LHFVLAPVGPLQVLGWALGRGPLAEQLPFRATLAFLLTPALPAVAVPAAGNSSRSATRWGEHTSGVWLLPISVQPLPAHTLVSQWPRDP